MKYPVAISLGIAVLGLALGYGLSLLWLWLALGLLWLVGEWRGRGRVAGPGLVALVGAAAFGVWQGRAAGWFLVSLTAALAAWDLGHFAGRMRQVAAGEIEPGLVSRHLRRLGVVAGAGMLLSGLALGLRLELNLGWAIFLGLLAILGLGRALRLSRSPTDDVFSDF